jgi:hypothetical protein
VKKTLARLLKEQSPKEYTLLTLFTEVENLINSRPIAWMSADSVDPPALTPNDFIRPSTFLGPSLEGQYEDRDLILRKQWRQAQRMADHFWQRWSREYMPNLNKRDKWTQDVRSVQVDDVVVVIDDQQPRNLWMKGIIFGVHPGADQVVRVVDVKTKNGVFRRPPSGRPD